MDLGIGDYGGSRGGLYPHGLDRMPKGYRKIGLRRAGSVEPLDVSGNPDATGRVVLLSVGMSNTLLEFQAFMDLAAQDPGLAPDLSIVQGAQKGEDAEKIADPSAPFWTNIDDRLGSLGLSPEQVQVVWLKEAVAQEMRAFPDDAAALRDRLRTIVGIMKARYPQLRIVYLSSRTYGGYSSGTLNPEPFAYESGFAVKWLIGHDIRLDSHDRPWLTWGPYLWTDGLAGRSDGLVWTCDDVQKDGVHPSASGQQKVADLLLSFFKTKATAAPWFLANQPPAEPTMRITPHI